MEHRPKFTFHHLTLWISCRSYTLSLETAKFTRLLFNRLNSSNNSNSNSSNSSSNKFTNREAVRVRVSNNRANILHPMFIGPLTALLSHLAHPNSRAIVKDKMVMVQVVTLPWTFTITTRLFRRNGFDLQDTSTHWVRERVNSTLDQLDLPTGCITRCRLTFFSSASFAGPFSSLFLPCHLLQARFICESLVRCRQVHES